MYNNGNTHPCPYYVNTPMYTQNPMYNVNSMNPYPCITNAPMYNPGFANPYPTQYFPYAEQADNGTYIPLKDYGPEPYVVDIEAAARQNNNYRTVLWTGKHLQLTLMSLRVGEDIGLEIHPNLDQFIRIEEGQGLVKIRD
jgi:hypothetical protein